MSDEPTNNELLLMQKNMLEKIEAFALQNSEDHCTIFRKLDITNGRLSSLEIWRARIIGGIAVLTIVVVPVVIYIITQILRF